MTDTVLLLASQSPRRQALLAQIGVAFEVLKVEVAEAIAPGETHGAYVSRLAEQKARAGAVLRPGCAVLGADTIGICDGELLEKPRDKADATRMLSLLSGNRHQVLTAVSVCRDQRQSTRLSVTEVRFRPLTAAEIEDYWATGEPQDKAGSYAIQGFGAVFVASLNGSYSGVVGLPLAETQALLSEFDIPWWRQSIAQSATQGRS